MPIILDITDGVALGGALSATATVVAPVVSIDATVSPNVLSATSAIIAPTVSIDATVSPSVLAATAAIVAPSISVDCTVSPSVLDAVASMLTPIITGGFMVPSPGNVAISDTARYGLATNDIVRYTLTLSENGDPNG